MNNFMENENKLEQLGNDLNLALRRVRASVLCGGQSNLEICYKQYLDASDKYWREAEVQNYRHH